MRPQPESCQQVKPNVPFLVAGHAGKLIFGLIGPAKLPVVLLVGRAHFYEGHTMDLVTFATRVCKVLGVQTMIGASPLPLTE